MGNKQFSFADITPQTGKTFLITGGTNGLGFSSAKVIASKGGKVYIVGRDANKCIAAVKEIKTHSNDADIEYFVADFGDLNQVKQLASEIKTRVPKLDVFLMNAGIGLNSYKVTASNLEQNFQVNHLSHFLLFKELEDLIVSSRTRIVTVSSAVVDLFPKVNMGYRYKIPASIKEINNEKEYRSDEAYALSKLYNILFAKSVSEKYGSRGVVAVATHPGTAKTNFATEADGSGWFTAFVGFVVNYFGSTPDVGALTQVYASTTDHIESGTTWEPVAKPWKIEHVINVGDSDALWRLSEDILREKGM